MRCEASVSLGCRDINKVMRFYDDSITELYLMAKRWEESWMLKWMGHKNRDVIPTFGWRRTPSRRLSSSRLSIVNGVYPWKKVRETFGRVYRVTLGQYCEWRNWTSSVFYKVIEYERIYMHQITIKFTNAEHSYLYGRANYCTKQYRRFLLFFLKTHKCTFEELTDI